MLGLTTEWPMDTGEGVSTISQLLRGVAALRHAQNTSGSWWNAQLDVCSGIFSSLAAHTLILSVTNATSENYGAFTP